VSELLQGRCLRAGQHDYGLVTRYPAVHIVVRDGLVRLIATALLPLSRCKDTF